MHTTLAPPRPRSTVPFVAKAVGHPIAKYASLLMSGKTLKDINFLKEPIPAHVAVKEVVLPFNKFPGGRAARRGGAGRNYLSGAAGSREQRGQWFGEAEVGRQVPAVPWGGFAPQQRGAGGGRGGWRAEVGWLTAPRAGCSLEGAGVGHVAARPWRPWCLDPAPWYRIATYLWLTSTTHTPAGADTLLGPEMRSTGEVMGIDKDFASAFAKAQIAAGQKLPKTGKVFLSMADKYKPDIVAVARDLGNLGFGLVATSEATHANARTFIMPRPAPPVCCTLHACVRGRAAHACCLVSLLGVDILRSPGP